MERFVNIHGDRYALAHPLQTSAGVARLLRDPINVSTFAAFLNEIGHREPASGPDFINITAYEAPIKLADRWTPRPEYAPLPMNFVTYFGAKAFADHHGLRLLSCEVWDILTHREAPQPPHDPVALNVEESHHGLIPSSGGIESPSGSRGLFGNVAFWGERINHGYAWCFGVGWNKSRHLLDTPMKKRRWVRDPSVSTGIRLMTIS